jgi:hypothetical protein
METGNATTFYQHRVKAPWEVEKDQRKELADVFKDYPNPISSMVSYRSMALEQERLETLQSEKHLKGTLQETSTGAQEQLQLEKGTAAMWNSQKEAFGTYNHKLSVQVRGMLSRLVDRIGLRH